MNKNQLCLRTGNMMLTFFRSFVFGNTSKTHISDISAHTHTNPCLNFSQKFYGVLVNFNGIGRKSCVGVC